MKVGDKVKWLHKPKFYYNRQLPFMASGTILKIDKYHRGGGQGKNKLAAKIKLRHHPYWVKIGYTTTVINLDKLEVHDDKRDIIKINK